MSPRARFPRPWCLVLAVAVPPEDRAALLDDLDEEYRRLRRDLGARAARRWARRQALRSLGPLIRRRLTPVAHRRATLHRLPRPGASPMRALLQDVGYAVRSLRSSPGYSVVVILVLALGIGANTAIFSLVAPFLFRPLPYDDPGRLVHVFETDPEAGGLGWDAVRQSWPTIQAWRQQADAFVALGADDDEGAAGARGSGEPASLTIGRVSADLFPMLGVEPIEGRLFAPADDVPGSENVVLVHESLWRGRYGADPELVGSTLRIDGREHVVLGIMPADFNFPFGSVRVWKPLAADPAWWDWTTRGLLTVGKLAAGVDADAAAAELEAIQRRLEEQHPQVFEGHGTRVAPLKEALIFFYDQLTAMMMLLLASVGFVLLIVCANVANLALARAGRQRGQIAIRAALGANRVRILRQLLAESLLLALVAAGAGALLARALIGAVATMIPAEIWRAGEIAVDAGALGYTLAVALLTSMAFGLWPARRAADVELTPALKAGRSGTDGLRGRRLTRGLVAAQVTVATVLCGGALMMVNAFQEFRDVELGFDPHRVATMRMTLAAESYPGGAEVRTFWDRLAEEATALAGVEAAGLIDRLPANFESSPQEYRLRDRQPGGDRERLRAALQRVNEGYFEAMGISLVQGRGFTAADGPDAETVIVINRLLARRHWPDGNPLGQSLELVRGDDVTEARIIGVVENSVGGFLMEGMQEQIFRTVAQSTPRSAFLVARGAGAPTGLVPALRRIVSELDPDLPVADVRTMEAVVAGSTEPLRVASQVLSSFGAFALLLAAIGVYGVVTYAVTRRTHELGVRMALGARPGDVLHLVLRSGGLLVVAGTLLGGLLTFLFELALTRATGIGTPTATTAVTVVALLGAVAGVATWLPARRATRIDPVIALRAE